MRSAAITPIRGLVPERGLRTDTWLLGAIIVLAVGGLLMVYSSSSALGMVREDNNDLFYLQSQLLRFVIGLAGLLVLSLFNMQAFPRQTSLIIWGLFIAALLLLLLPWGPGVEIRGTRRWMSLGGITIQPSEFARHGMILHLAWVLATKKYNLHSWRGLMWPVLIILATSGLIAFQPHLSLGLLTLFSGFLLLFLAGASIWRLLLMGLGALGLAGSLAIVAGKGYHLIRMGGFFSGLSGDLAYQAEQSILAIGSGGLVGKGIGQGLQKFFFLPDPHTDFIMSIVVEECGFIGLIVLFLVVGFILFRIFVLGSRSSLRFSELYCYGIGVQFLLAFILHAAVCLGLVPITGVPLPLVSFGGSALVANMMGLGLVLSTANGRAKPFRCYREDWARLMRDPTNKRGRR